MLQRQEQHTGTMVVAITTTRCFGPLGLGDFTQQSPPAPPAPPALPPGCGHAARGEPGAGQRFLGTFA